MWSQSARLLAWHVRAHEVNETPEAVRWLCRGVFSPRTPAALPQPWQHMPDGLVFHVQVGMRCGFGDAPPGNGPGQGLFMPLCLRVCLCVCMPSCLVGAVRAPVCCRAAVWGLSCRGRSLGGWGGRPLLPCVWLPAVAGVLCSLWVLPVVLLGRSSNPGRSWCIWRASFLPAAESQHTLWAVRRVGVAVVLP